MNVHECIRAIGSAPPGPVYLFCPAKAPKAKAPSYEPFLAERAVERMIEAYVDPSMKDLSLAVYYADETPPGEIVLEALSLPFIAERRVVVVRNAEHCYTESVAGPILAYLENPSETTVLLLVAARVDKRTRFYKACKQAGQIVECPELKEREVGRWVAAEARARGKRIEPRAVRAIVGRAGTHLFDVDNALNLVTNYVGDADVIREVDVLAACADVAEEEVWALTDAIAASRAGDALRALRRLLDLGKHEDDLMGIINWLLKSAYAVAAAGAEKPKINPFVAEKVTPLAEKLGVRKLRDAFALCTDTHFMIRSTGVRSDLALELLVVKLATAEARAQPA